MKRLIGGGAPALLAIASTASQAGTPMPVPLSQAIGTPTPGPYAGQQHSAIRGLTEAEIQAFREGTLTLETLAQRTAEIGSVEGELRATHLKYHLLTRPLLTDDQLVTYARLRGYPDEPATPQHTPGRHGNHGS